MEVVATSGYHVRSTPCISPSTSVTVLNSRLRQDIFAQSHADGERARFFIWRQLGKDRGIKLVPRLRRTKFLDDALDWNTASRSICSLFLQRCVTYILGDAAGFEVLIQQPPSIRAETGIWKCELVPLI